jgi:hypothetical protein
LTGYFARPTAVRPIGLHNLAEEQADNHIRAAALGNKPVHILCYDYRRQVSVELSFLNGVALQAYMFRSLHDHLLEQLYFRLLDC